MEKLFSILKTIWLNITRVLVVLLAMGSAMWVVFDHGIQFFFIIGLMAFLFVQLLGRMKYYVLLRFWWVSIVCFVAAIFMLCAVGEWVIDQQSNTAPYAIYLIPWFFGGGDYTFLFDSQQFRLPAVGRILFKDLSLLASGLFSLPILALFLAIFFPGFIKEKRRIKEEDSKYPF